MALEVGKTGPVFFLKKKSVPYRNIRMIHLYTFIVFEMAFADSICQLPSDLDLTPGNADKRLSNG